MKALTCEMCGSTNLIKEDGVFVCQSCGTKYSVEEAKKMMVEGTVSITGTVTVANTGSVENYLMLANNAYQAGNQKEAELYCNKIIEIVPNHSEAWLIKGKAAGWQTTLANVRLDESINSFMNAINYADEDKLSDIKSSVLTEIESLSIASLTLACNHFEEFPQGDSVDNIRNILNVIINNALPLVGLCDGNLDKNLANIGNVLGDCGTITYKTKVYLDYHRDTYPSEYDWKDYVEGTDGCLDVLRLAVSISQLEKELLIDYYQNMIKFQQELILSCSYTYSDGGYVKDYSFTDEAKNLRADMVMEWHQKIKELNPDYVIPSRPSTSSGGCYVATSIYGSYDCSEVWVLRRFRDFTLSKTWYGCAFIKLYYSISPTFVKLFGEKKWFKTFFKQKLDKFVTELQSKGYKNTPYNDRTF